MNRLSDEILNKYLDNELSEPERIEVSRQIELFEDDKKRFAALQAVHNSLKKAALPEVSPDFTSLLMSKLMKQRKAKSEQKFFIISVGSVFVIIILIVLGFLISSILNTQTSSSVSIMDNLVSFMADIGGKVSLGFSGKNISIVGSILSFALILTAYFFFDYKKHTDHWFGKTN